jgi:hypothetical protein
LSGWFSPLFPPDILFYPLDWYASEEDFVHGMFASSPPISSLKAQFGYTFIDQYGREIARIAKKINGTGIDAPTRAVVRDKIEENNHAALQLWIKNGIRSLPTNEDLRKTYFWESRRLGAQESEKHASEKRLSRLKRLWKAQWFSPIQLRIDIAQDSASSDKGSGDWQAAFAVIQGHRFIWWQSVRDFDNGELPAGRLSLSGHAGLTGPSPIEVRGLSSEDLENAVTIFGRGSLGQERVAMLVPDSTVKERLENTVLGVSSKED